MLDKKKIVNIHIYVTFLFVPPILLIILVFNDNY